MGDKTGLAEVRLASRSSRRQGATGGPVEGESVMEAPEDQNGGGSTTRWKKGPDPLQVKITVNLSPPETLSHHRVSE